MEQQVEEITNKIVSKGDEIRLLKAEKKEQNKEALQQAINQLLALKNEYKTLTGKEYGPPPKPKKEKTSAPPRAATSSPKEAQGVEEEGEGKKSKKQLNKERKKAQKAAIKAGETPTPSVDQAPKAQSSPSKTKKTPEKAKSSSPSRKSNTKPVSVVTGPVGKTLTPEELAAFTAGTTNENGATIIFSSSATNQLPLVSFIVAKLLNLPIKTLFQNVDIKNLVPTLIVEKTIISGDFAIARYLARTKLEVGLYGGPIGVSQGPENVQQLLVLGQIDSWLDFALTMLNTTGLALLNTIVQERTFIVGYGITLADIALWARLIRLDTNQVSTYPFVKRYFDHLNTQELFLTAQKQLTNLVVQKKKISSTSSSAISSESSFVSQKGKNSGNCPPLEGGKQGQVCTRFPPEPSGYLHIGHIKACLLNHYYAKHYNGKLIVRFDDTNPSKEKEEFEQSILSDLKKLDIVPDVVTYTSDHFETIIQFARQLIKEGKAYMDNTSQEQMREERMNGIESKCRHVDAVTNLKLFELMLKDAPESQGYCLRGKIDMQAKNKTLRDPVFFRVNTSGTPHHRTGTKYKAYPTYDFACPIVDSIEGVTHALRTTEYNDRDAQYAWVLKALKLRQVKIHAFARMNFVHSVLSKRKLQWFVDNKHVDGWNDPRFPTVQGVLRRGVQVEALREFILSQGASRRITDMEWDKFWTINKRVIDPIAPRYFALDQDRAIPLELTNVPDDQVIGLPIARHPKNPSMGNKIMRFGRHLLVEQDDVVQFQENEEVTLMRHGNIKITKLHKNTAGEITKVDALNYPEGDFRKTKLKITWLAQMNDLVPTKLIEFDHLISKPKLEENDNFQDHLTPITRAEMNALGDHEMRNLLENQIIQLERRGFFRVDRPYLSKQKPLILFMVPDGKAKAMSTLSKNLAHR